MHGTTNSLVAKAKRLAVPAGILATVLFAPHSSSITTALMLPLQPVRSTTRASPR